MTWFKVDDGFWSNPKVIELSDSATSLWVKAGSYCCQHLTDGVVKPSVLRLLGTEESAEELVAAGLWKSTSKGFVFHDWVEYQETSGAVKGRREQAKERMRKAREKRKSSQNVRANNKRTTSERSDEQQANVRENFARSSHNPDPTRPDPTRPDLSPKGDKKISTDRASTSDESPAKSRPSKSSLFDEFWAVVPLKTGKKAARKAWDSAVKLEEPAKIIESMRRYTNDPNRDASFTKHPATWLNKGCWDDDPLPSRGGGGSKRNDLDVFMDAFAGRENRGLDAPQTVQQSLNGVTVPEQDYNPPHGHTAVMDAEFWEQDPEQEPPPDPQADNEPPF